MSATAAESWARTRSFHHSAYPPERIAAEREQSISVCLPARECAATVAAIVTALLELREEGAIEEVVVVDAASEDGTAELAERAGARVLQEAALMPERGPVLGKGDAMWRALSLLDSDIVAFADADTEAFGGQFLTGLLGPLLCEPAVQLVKGCFRRPFREGAALLPEGGGRVTELMARPLLNLHAPELAVFDQPLAGEVAARRDLLEQIPFSAGYGVEIAMLIDAWRIVGLDGLAQVDLGVRQNRHQPLRDLSAMAYAVLVAASTRLLGSAFADANAAGSLSLPPLQGQEQIESRRVPIEERPALRDYRAERDRAEGCSPV